MYKHHALWIFSAPSQVNPGMSTYGKTESPEPFGNGRLELE